MMCFSLTCWQECSNYFVITNSSIKIPRVFVYVMIVLLICLIFPHSSSAQAEPELLKKQFVSKVTPDSSSNNGTCRVNCRTLNKRPVCGTDGRTYESKCELRHLRKCEGMDVKIAATGKCPSEKSRRKSKQGKCAADREQVLSYTAPQDYIPECVADGSYAQVQCHKATGYCWCVTPDGKPIPSTSDRGRNVDCKTSKGSTKRHRTNKGSMKKRGISSKHCNQGERMKFNENFIRLFTQEFKRATNAEMSDTSQWSNSDDVSDKVVVEWKFRQLDSDDDLKLRRKEIRSLKKMVKRIVKPKTCAKNFDDYCDLNDDGGIEKSEWCICLGVDRPTDNERLPYPPMSEVTVDNGGTPGGMMPPDESFLALIGRKGSRPTLYSSFDNPAQPPSSEVEHTAQNDDSSTPGQRNCLTERRAAEETHNNAPEGKIFIPECIDGGLYKQVQCHKYTGYCWCADPKTGHPIPGTSTHNVTPDCSKTARIDFKGAQLQGCPYKNKKLFLTHLLDQLTEQMIDYYNGNNSQQTVTLDDNPDYSIEERAVRWKLKVLDDNSNNILERKEMKNFKSDIKMTRELRKCSRNFVRYCDANADRDITLEEWIDCMGIHEQKRNLPDSKDREGPNPFNTYLKSYP